MKRLTALFPALAALVAAVGFINFFAFFATSTRAGGSALSGYAANNHYFLGNKGTFIEVPQALWERQRLHEQSIIVTHPLAMLAMAYLVRRSFARSIYRAPTAAIATTVASVRASGPLIRAIDCAGAIGRVHASGPLIRAELYPGGITVKLRTLPPVAVPTHDIVTLRDKQTWTERGIEITHRSPQMISPIRLRCEHDAAFCCTLEHITQQTIQRGDKRRS